MVSRGGLGMANVGCVNSVPHLLPQCPPHVPAKHVPLLHGHVQQLNEAVCKLRGSKDVSRNKIYNQWIWSAVEGWVRRMLDV
jgi:hypothetical protein